MDKFEAIVSYTFIAIFAVIGIACIVNFIITLMWHFLMMASISAVMVWALYNEDIKSSE